MKAAENEGMIRALQESVEELQQRVENHRRLVASIARNRGCNGEFREVFPVFSHESREARFRQAILETIEVLEESRKAFKSKRLEFLRKRLILLLTEPPK